ncbi:MAG TPA: zinc-dependent metalloprotease [Thermomicrobiales bacterium]|nr:zinc-dependent metalloprotease [Thermomicrobiales bacterium]
MSNNTAGQSGSRSTLAAGVVLGAAALVWAGKRVQEFAKTDRPTGMVNWDRALEIALRMNKESALTAVERSELSAYYARLVDECVPLISDYTQTTLPESARETFAFDRVDWIHANLAGFQRMFAPIEDLDAGPGKNRNPVSKFVGGINQTVLSTEIGLLLGYMAKRVLGQYDLALLGREPVTSGKLYYVEPNIRGIERKLDLPKDDFRMWLALHETTHAFEFEAYPWVREHFNGLLERYMGFMRDDAEYLKQGVEGVKVMMNRLRDGRNGDADDAGSWIEGFMNPEQRAVFVEMQALMCVIEGYSNHVMNAVGRDLLKTYDLISKRFEERQKQRSTGEKLFAQLTGLNVKMEQYRQGEAFVNAIVERHGRDAITRLWQGPESMPSMQEIRDPSQWSDRVFGQNLN